MPRGIPSLLAGRNPNPLTEEEVQRVVAIFFYMDGNVNVRHDPASPTSFQVAQDQDGHDYGEVVFGPDIYPGTRCG